MTIGGAERAVYQLVREQRRRGAIADVAIASTPGVYGDELAQGDGRVHELRCHGSWDVIASAKLTSLASAYSVVHVHGIEPLLIAASVRSSAQLVYTHRGGTRDHGLVKRTRLAVARPLVRRFDAITANTRQSARVAAQWLGIPIDTVHVVYNGLDFELLQPRRARADVLAELPESWRDDVLVGTAANLQPLKRIERLLEAIAALDGTARCVVVGDGPARPDLERRAIDLGIADRVAFLGSKEHIGDYLQILGVFVLPSGPEESFGNAAVEAMGMCIPTVVFADGGGLVEHVVDRRTGLVVRDVEGLQDALRVLVDDPVLRNRLGSTGMEHVRATYSLNSMADGYDAVYRAIAAARA